MDRKLDYARLTSSRDQPSVPLHMADPAELVGAKVGLCTFHVRLEEELEDFDMSLSAMPVSFPSFVLCAHAIPKHFK